MTAKNRGDQDKFRSSGGELVHNGTQYHPVVIGTIQLVANEFRIVRRLSHGDAAGRLQVCGEAILTNREQFGVIGHDFRSGSISFELSEEDDVARYHGKKVFESERSSEAIGWATIIPSLAVHSPYSEDSRWGISAYLPALAVENIAELVADKRLARLVLSLTPVGIYSSDGPAPARHDGLCWFLPSGERALAGAWIEALAMF